MAHNPNMRDLLMIAEAYSQSMTEDFATEPTPYQGPFSDAPVEDPFRDEEPAIPLMITALADAPGLYMKKGDTLYVEPTNNHGEVYSEENGLTYDWDYISGHAERGMVSVNPVESEKPPEEIPFKDGLEEDDGDDWLSDAEYQMIKDVMAQRGHEPHSLGVDKKGRLMAKDDLAKGSPEYTISNDGEVLNLKYDIGYKPNEQEMEIDIDDSMLSNPFESINEAATRKDFRMVADLISKIEDQDLRLSSAEDHAKMFALQNPRFSKNKFMAACNASFMLGKNELGEDFPAQGSEQECAWWAGCNNEATTTEPHPVLGAVPICDRCAGKLRKIEGLDEDEYDEYDDDDFDEDDERYDKKNAEVEKFKGRKILVTDLYDGDVYGYLGNKRFMISSPLDRGWGTGHVSDDEIEVSDPDFSLSPKEEAFLKAWHSSIVNEDGKPYATMKDGPDKYLFRKDNKQKLVGSADNEPEAGEEALEEAPGDIYNVDGYIYRQHELPEEDVVKLWHYMVTPEGEEVYIDYSPYQELDKDEFAAKVAAYRKGTMDKEIREMQIAAGIVVETDSEDNGWCADCETSPCECSDEDKEWMREGELPDALKKHQFGAKDDDSDDDSDDSDDSDDADIKEMQKRAGIVIEDCDETEEDDKNDDGECSPFTHADDNVEMVREEEQCSECDGVGEVWGKPCEKCGGEKALDENDNPLGVENACPECSGTGMGYGIEAGDCEACAGSGIDEALTREDMLLPPKGDVGRNGEGRGWEDGVDTADYANSVGDDDDRIEPELDRQTDFDAPSRYDGDDSFDMEEGADSDDPHAQECSACGDIAMSPGDRLDNGDVEWNCENCGHYEVGGSWDPRVNEGPGDDVKNSSSDEERIIDVGDDEDYEEFDFNDDFDSLFGGPGGMYEMNELRRLAGLEQLEEKDIVDGQDAADGEDEEVEVDEGLDNGDSDIVAYEIADEKAYYVMADILGAELEFGPEDEVLVPRARQDEIEHELDMQGFAQGRDFAVAGQMFDDLQNGYDDRAYTDGKDYFPGGATSSPSVELGPAGAKQGDNPMRTPMASVDKDEPIYESMKLAYRRHRRS